MHKPFGVMTASSAKEEQQMATRHKFLFLFCTDLGTLWEEAASPWIPATGSEHQRKPHVVLHSWSVTSDKGKISVRALQWTVGASALTILVFVFTLSLTRHMCRQHDNDNNTVCEIHINQNAKSEMTPGELQPDQCITQLEATTRLKWTGLKCIVWWWAAAEEPQVPSLLFLTGFGCLAKMKMNSSEGGRWQNTRK